MAARVASSLPGGYMAIRSTTPLPAQPGIAVLPICSTLVHGAAVSISSATRIATLTAAGSYSTYAVGETTYGRMGDFATMPLNQRNPAPQSRPK